LTIRFIYTIRVFAITANVYGGGLALSGVGSKAIGMGGAFRGLADNWSAAYWNPAGLAQLEQSEVNVMGILINPMPEYNPDYRYGNFDVGYKNGEFRYPKDEAHFVPNVSCFYKMKDRDDITFGISIFVPYALGSEWDLFDPLYDDVVASYPVIDHSATLKVIDYHPSIAKSFFDEKLMLGVGFSALNGDVEFQKTYLTEFSFLDYPHNIVATDGVIKGEGWGYGANFGMLYKLSEKLQFGNSGKTPSTIKLDGDVNSTLYAIDNLTLENSSRANATTLIDSMKIDFIFSNPTLGARNWTKNAKADLKLPGDIGLGIAYDASDKLKLTMDFAYTMWSRLDSIVVVSDTSSPPFYIPSDTTSSIVTKWDNTLRFSAGGLYQIIEPLQLRFGFFLDPSPIPDETFSPLFLDIGTKYSGNLGAALTLDKWEIGYNFEYIHFGEREIASSGSDFINYPGLFKAYLIANHVSMTYRF
jgi:long-chain fatty acid transport protein